MLSVKLLTARSAGLALISMLVSQSAGAQAPPNIESVALFKNGLAVVSVTEALPDSGSLSFDPAPSPIHGAFWITSSTAVEGSVTYAEVAAPLDAVSKNRLLRSLIGQDVTLISEGESLQGRLLGDAESAEEARLIRDDDNDPGVLRSSAPRILPLEPPLVFLALQSGGIVSLEAGRIERVQFEQLPEFSRQRPVLTLSSDTPGEVEIDYLARGLSWAPSYRIDIASARRMTIIQTAEIRNEMAALDEVEISLITGFPSVQYAGVDSLLSPQQTWATFFMQLQRAGGGPTDNAVMSQMRFAAEVAPDALAGVEQEPEGLDLHYQPVGRHSIEPGEVLTIEVSRAESEYSRVVEWNIPDTRSPNGQPVDAFYRGGSGTPDDEEPWDVIVFENPFDFPMTTAPASVLQNGEFLGQQTANWVNSGVETSVRVNKALSIEGRLSEEEQAQTRQSITSLNRNGYRVEVLGTVMVTNRRSTAVEMHINRQFSGELLAADANPELSLLESGVYSLNRRNALEWRFELAAGETRTLTYRYEVFVI